MLFRSYDTVKADQFITLKGKRQEVVEKTVEQVIYEKITTTFMADYHNSVGGDWLQTTKGVINLHSDGDFVVDTKANVGVNAMQGIAAQRAHQARALLPAVRRYAETARTAIGQARRLDEPLARFPARAVGGARGGLILFGAEQGFAGAFPEQLQIGRAHV